MKGGPTGIQAEGLTLEPGRRASDVTAPGGRRLRAIRDGQLAHPRPVRWGGEASPTCLTGEQLGPPLLRARVKVAGLPESDRNSRRPPPTPRPQRQTASTRRDSQGWSGTVQGFLILYYAPNFRRIYCGTVLRLL